MRIIVCGGRNYQDGRCVADVLNRFPADAVVITGAARGADKLAEEVAILQSLATVSYPADWDQYGRAAGVFRNRHMLDMGADYVVAFPGGRGTANMIEQAMARGVPVLSCDAVIAEWPAWWSDDGLWTAK